MEKQRARMPRAKTSLIDSLPSLICWIKTTSVKARTMERKAVVEYPKAIKAMITDIDIPKNNETRKAFRWSVRTVNNFLFNGSFVLSPIINAKIFPQYLLACNARNVNDTIINSACIPKYAYRGVCQLLMVKPFEKVS